MHLSISSARKVGKVGVHQKYNRNEENGRRWSAALVMVVIANIAHKHYMICHIREGWEKVYLIIGLLNKAAHIQAK